MIALTDQIDAGAFMWVVPASALTLRVLTNNRLVRTSIRSERIHALAR